MKAVQRAIVLVGLGCLLASLQARGLVWTLGVLQLIGLAYLCAAWAGTWLGVRGRAMLAILLLAAHTALLAYYRVPGVPVGTLSEHANVVNHLNQAYLAPLGLKGLISVIPATAMVLIGTLAGDFLRRKRISRPLKVAGLAGAGLALWGIGVWWSAYLTLNKALWTGSYIVYTAGLGLCTLAALYLLFDAPKGIGGKATRLLAFPFVVFGTNAIVAYVAPIAFKLAVLQRFEIAHPTGTIVNLERALQEWCYAQVGRIPGGWLYTISYIAAWWLVLLVLYRKRWFLRA
jgi:predicted acyltransferase